MRPDATRGALAAEVPVYDVVIVGASFAGLAVANSLCGRRVLLIDRKPVGEESTSACCSILRAMTYWGLEDAVLQTHDSLVLHTRRRAIRFGSPYPWCTFDYGLVCDILFRRSGADFMQATARGVVGDSVQTDAGDVRGRCIVDASGWRAALSGPPTRFRRRRMNYGVNMICPMPVQAGLDRSALHFWYSRDVMSAAIAWVFPRGDTATIGMGSYRGPGAMRTPMERFSRGLGVAVNGLRGAYFPHALRQPSAGNVFVVGDAAGQCIGLTGEGVRPALYFGEACGRAIERVLSGELTLPEGLAEYAAFVARKERFYRFFSRAQDVLTRVPAVCVDWLSLYTASERMRARVLTRYWGLTREWGLPS